MEPRHADRTHDDLRSLLGAFALDAVTAAERRDVLAHLAGCEECRAEVAHLRVAVDALPLALDEREPSPLLRDRIEVAVLADLAHDRPAPLDRPDPASPIAPPTPLRRPAPTPWAFGPWAAAAALLLVVSLGLLAWNLRLQGEVRRGPAARTFALQPAPEAPGASGELAYLPDRGVMILSVRDLPPLAAGQVYEVWLIGGDGVPVPAGVFAEPTAEHAIAADPDRYQAVAITPEPGPLGLPAPTGEVVAQVPLTT